eukprot:TRINITY_DN28292_c0_g1_i1.p1 TRINITY_DN28292_c0_g1~~TRINITY_DN28292_c0_g1_i1.p1  ORF type:complete len:261 (+),score=52.69 TRINITY_DN28292_c0_g1_i1:71-784(+)
MLALVASAALTAVSQPPAEHRFAELKQRVRKAEYSQDHARGRRRNATAHGEVDGCEWDDTELVGKCVAGSKKSPGVTSAEQCRRRCCGAGLECVSWQYRSDTGCLLMEDVRVGAKEHSARDTTGFCEDTAPAPWRGRVLLRRNSGKGCQWADKLLDGQCWGLGPVRKAGSASERACAAECCADPECRLYQWRQDKGCFYTHKEPRCDQLNMVPFAGGRRVIPGGCKVKHGKIVCRTG